MGGSDKRVNRMKEQAIEVHLYGRLRRYAPDPRPDRNSVVYLEPQASDTVAEALAYLDLSPEEVYHVFLNGALLTTRNSMAPWLKYQRSASSGLDTELRPGDRLGLFAQDMALLVV